MYGGDEFAMKAAGHELKSLTELIACHIPKLHFPLMATIDFLGLHNCIFCLFTVGRTESHCI